MNVVAPITPESGGRLLKKTTSEKKKQCNN